MQKLDGSLRHTCTLVYLHGYCRCGEKLRYILKGPCIAGCLENKRPAVFLKGKESYSLTQESQDTKHQSNPSFSGGSEYLPGGPLCFCMPWAPGGDRAPGHRVFFQKELHRHDRGCVRVLLAQHGATAGLRAVLPTAQYLQQPWGESATSWWPVRRGEWMNGGVSWDQLSPHTPLTVPTSCEKCSWFHLLILAYSLCPGIRTMGGKAISF